MATDERSAAVVQLEEAWFLVDELGRLSLELKQAAIAAQQLLGLTTEEGHPS